MDAFRIISLFATLLIITVIPGPGMLLGFQHGMRYGAKKATATALGMAISSFLLVGITLLGLGSIFVQSEKVYYMMKIVGAVYLIYLGLRTFFQSKNEYSQESMSRRPIFWRRLFLESFFVGLGNPKAIILYAALFPQFLQPQQTEFMLYAALSCFAAIISFFSLMFYAKSGEKLVEWFKRDNVQQLFHRLIGGLFIAVGLKIVFDR